jgi:hypothetical protein
MAMMKSAVLILCNVRWMIGLGPWSHAYPTPSSKPNTLQRTCQERPYHRWYQPAGDNVPVQFHRATPENLNESWKRTVPAAAAAAPRHATETARCEITKLRPPVRPPVAGLLAVSFRPYLYRTTKNCPSNLVSNARTSTRTDASS